MADRAKRGERRPETFDFLGFTHYCRTTRNGGFGLGRKPVAKRVRRTLQAIKAELRKRMHANPKVTGRWLGRATTFWWPTIPLPAKLTRSGGTTIGRWWPPGASTPTPPPPRSTGYIRCGNGPELTANALRDWCRFSGTGSSYIEPGAPWENPYVE